MSVSSGFGLELFWEVFHDPLRNRVSDGVDLGEDIVEGGDVIVPSLVKSCFDLFLRKGQMLME